MRIDVNKIMRLLAEQEMTFSELSLRSTVSRQLISTIVRRGSCTPKTAGRIAVGLGVPVAEIMM